VDAPEAPPEQRGPLGWVTAAVGVVLLVTVVAAAFLGPDSVQLNLAPWAVFSGLWAGGLTVSALVGDAWRPFDPVRALATAQPGTWGDEQTPRGVFPAAVLLAGFVWLDLVSPTGNAPRVLGLVMLGALLVVLVPGFVLGRGWTWGADPIARTLSVLAQAAPVHRGPDGRITVSAPMVRLPRLRWVPGLTTLLLVALGGALFDSLRASEAFVQVGQAVGVRVTEFPDWGQVPLATAGLLVSIGVAALAWTLAMRSAARDSGQDRAELSRAFTHVLVPVVIGQFLAHTVGRVVTELQVLWVLASDPLGRGWALFGTASGSVSLDVLSGAVVAWTQVTVMLLGGVAAVLLAHDRSVARFEGDTVQTAQTGMLVAIVAYTVGGTMLLLGS
jgi:hypothetical protein